MKAFDWLLGVILRVVRWCIKLGFAINSVNYILLDACSALLYEQEVRYQVWRETR